MKSLKHINKYFLKYRWHLLLGILFVAVSNIFGVYSFLYVGDAIDFVDEIAKNISDEKSTKKDAQEFLNSLELILYKRGIEKNKDGLKAIIKARDYMNDRSPSIKQLLEYIVLNI